MSRSTFAVAEKLPVAKIAIVRRPIAPAFEHDDAFAKIDELLDLEAPTRRGQDLTRELAAVSSRMDDFDEERPTRITAPNENMRLIAASIADDEITIDAPSPLSALAHPRVASFIAETAPEPPRSGVQVKAAPDDQRLIVAGIWAAALSAMGVLVFFLA